MAHGRVISNSGKLYFGVILAGFLLTGLTLADDYRDFNVALAEQYLMPRYYALEEATAQQQHTLTTFCQAPDAEGLAQSQSAFHASMDAWMQIQHVRLGPIQLAFRAERINHWPERRNAVSKTLRKWLAEKDQALLDPDTFATSSVAGQGLPTLERLLFAPDALQQYREDDYRCQLTLAIGRNLATISREVVTEWQQQVLPVLVVGGEHPIYFENPEAATRQLLTDLQTLLQVITDQKLEQVLGKTSAEAKPKQAENRRSDRSIRNLLLNLASARAMYADTQSGFVRLMPHTPDAEALNARIAQALTTAESALKTLEKPLDQAVQDPSERAKIEQALKATRSIRNALQDEIPAMLGINTGFNSLDGD
ncbi:MAG: imelysin family protein [Gammaproteobacteria bacterium]